MKVRIEKIPCKEKCPVCGASMFQRLETEADGYVITHVCANNETHSVRFGTYKDPLEAAQIMEREGWYKR